MKIPATLIVAILALPAQAISAPAEFAGTFKGTDKNEVHGCMMTNFNGVSTDPSWTLTHDVKENAVTGKGSNAFGEFTVEGTISGNTAKGVMMRVNKWNMPWNGEFSATVEGDTLKFLGSGSVGGGSGCKFNSEVTAKKS